MNWQKIKKTWGWSPKIKIIIIIKNMQSLAEELYQKAQNQADEIRKTKIKLIATQNDYEDLQNYLQMYKEGKIDLHTYNNIAKDIMGMMERRWGIGIE